jgi:uncharacterized protein with FMN-binding domain
MARSTGNTIVRTLKWAAFLTLIMGYAAGFMNRDREVLPLLIAKVPEAASWDRISDHPLVLGLGPGQEGTTAAGYATVSRAQGWGGPLVLAVQVDGEGRIERIRVLDHNETLAFFYRLEKRAFFQQFESRHVGDPLWPGEDIDTVTQATVSSEAFTEAVRKGGQALGREVFGLDIKERPPRWRIGWEEAFLVLLFAAAYLSMRGKGFKVLRYTVMAAAFFFLGFHLNASLSIAHFGGLLLGYVPRVITHPLWWILVGGALATSFFLKKNLYCHALCPFGSLQEVNARISGSNLPVARVIARAARALPWLLTWLALMSIFLANSPASGAFEPFPTLFGFEGMEIQWMILAAVILGSLFMKRFFCRFFCPVGAGLDLVIRARCRISGSRKKERGCPG